jgi:DNA-binding NarL/FixJ family response regulator
MSSANSGPSTKKVLLVEDQTAIRQMLAKFISAMPGFSVVGEASDVGEAARQIEARRPDVVVLDWMLAGETGSALLRAVQASPTCPHVLVFSANTTGVVVRDAFALGACGFIEKTASFQEFTVALTAASEGRAYLGPAISSAISQLVRNPGFDNSALTAREREILRYVAEGLSSKMIASKLGISIRTVHSHRSSLIRKTGLHSIAELTLYAFEQGLVERAPAA